LRCATPAINCKQKTEGSKYPRNIAWFLIDFLHWTGTDKLADSETKLGNALLIVDGGLLQPPGYGRALFEGLMVRWCRAFEGSQYDAVSSGSSLRVDHFLRAIGGWLEAPSARAIDEW
jgi:hypothetical protein